MSDETINRILQLYEPFDRQDYVARQTELLHIYRHLTEADAQQLVERVRMLPDDKFEAILGALACYWPSVIPHHELLARDILTSPHVYRDADQSVVDELLSRLRAMPYDWLLLASLAWADGPRVVQQFAQWRANPPEQRSRIYTPLEARTQEAGWTLTADGQRRDLFLPTAYRLVARGDTASESPVTILRYVDESCPWCGRRLVDLFDFDLASPALAFVGLEGARLRIRTCLSCASFQPVFAEATRDGLASWSTANGVPTFKYAEEWGFPEDRLTLGEQRPTPYESLAMSYMFSSQVGGCPEWEQHAEYPDCPICHDPMLCIAQVETGDLLGQPADGHFYAFFCADCGQAATHYQQT